VDCPVCEKPMVVLEIDQIEIDHCVHCGGTWLDAGELELLLEGSADEGELPSAAGPGAADGETPRRCPICGKKMGKVVCAGRGESVVLDRCKRSDGLWFDGGELRALVKMGDSPRESRIYKLLDDVFGGNG
jgi:Zn-finger nucleic acid-binding protein